MTEEDEEDEEDKNKLQIFFEKRRTNQKEIDIFVNKKQVK